MPGSSLAGSPAQHELSLVVDRIPVLQSGTPRLREAVNRWEEEVMMGMALSSAGCPPFHPCCASTAVWWGIYCKAKAMCTLLHQFAKGFGGQKSRYCSAVLYFAPCQHQHACTSLHSYRSLIHLWGWILLGNGHR